MVDKANHVGHPGCHKPTPAMIDPSCRRFRISSWGWTQLWSLGGKLWTSTPTPHIVFFLIV